MLIQANPGTETEMTILMAIFVAIVVGGILMQRAGMSPAKLVGGIFKPIIGLFKGKKDDAG